MTLDQVRLIRVPNFTAENGMLTVFEGSSLGFEVRRVFVVHGMADAIRGMHAHKECTQALVAISGQVSVDCETRFESARYELGSPIEALVLPPMTWATQTFKTSRSILLVACNRPYEEEDYIRDIQVFRSRVETMKL